MERKLICVLIGLLVICCTYSQEYKIVKVTLREGLILKGKNALISNQTLNFTSGSALRTYSLNDVNIIQAKEGKAGKWALGFGGGCLGLCIISGIASGQEGIEAAGATVGTYVAGSILWTGIFACLGALIGNGVDQWEIVYNRNTSSIWKNFDFNIGSTQKAKYNFSLSYKF
jgi:hypothetical protein